MTAVHTVCPLCGTALSPERFARVMEQHRGWERQLAAARDMAARAQGKLRDANQKVRQIRRQARASADKRVKAERQRAEDRVRRHRKTVLRLNERVQDLERRLKMGETAQSEGLLEERVLLAFLKEHFPDDEFDHVGKGGDILHDVIDRRAGKAGRIVYEVKRVSTWSSAHVKQCADACAKREASVAILVTNRFPAKRPYYFVEHDVIVISPLAILPLVHTVREGLLNVHSLRVSGNQKTKAVRAIYDYLAGGPYTQHMRLVAQHLFDLDELLRKEEQSHQRVWAHRRLHYRGIAGGVATIHDRLRGLLIPIEGATTTALLPAAKMRLPKFLATDGKTRKPS